MHYRKWTGETHRAASDNDALKLLLRARVHVQNKDISMCQCVCVLIFGVRGDCVIGVLELLLHHSFSVNR